MHSVMVVVFACIHSNQYWLAVMFDVKYVLHTTAKRNTKELWRRIFGLYAWLFGGWVSRQVMVECNYCSGLIRWTGWARLWLSLIYRLVQLPAWACRAKVVSFLCPFCLQMWGSFKRFCLPKSWCTSSPTWEKKNCVVLHRSASGLMKSATCSHYGE